MSIKICGITSWVGCVQNPIWRLEQLEAFSKTGRNLSLFWERSLGKLMYKVRNINAQYLMYLLCDFCVCICSCLFYFDFWMILNVHVWVWNWWKHGRVFFVDYLKSLHRTSSSSLQGNPALSSILQNLAKRRYTGEKLFCMILFNLFERGYWHIALIWFDWRSTNQYPPPPPPPGITLNRTQFTTGLITLNRTRHLPICYYARHAFNTLA
jgi:hypothetical protein